MAGIVCEAISTETSFISIEVVSTIIGVSTFSCKVPLTACSELLYSSKFSRFKKLLSSRARLEL